MSARRRASPYGSGRPIRWGTASNGCISNASRLPQSVWPPSAINSPDESNVSQGPPAAAHRASPCREATQPASSSSSLVSLPVRRASAPHLERYTRGHRESAFAIARDPALLQAAIDDLESLRYVLRVSSGRTSVTTELLGFYRSAGATRGPCKTHCKHGVRSRGSPAPSRLQVGQLRC